MFTGKDNLNSGWFQPLHADLASLPAENEEDTINVDQEMATGNQSSDSDDDISDNNRPKDASFSSLTGNLPQDPQIVKIDGLRAQSSLMRQYEQRLTSHKQELRRKLHEMFTSLECNLETNPEVFKSPIESFTSSFFKIHNHSHLVSALHSFGKYSGVAIAARKICRKAARHQRLQTSSQIKVQPTSVARRKMLLGGRRRLHMGRPSKAEYTAEHGYSKRKPAKTSLSQLPPRRKPSAPHHLSHCVSQNITLGKTHSSK